jgi:hypothetical protein
MYGTSPEKKIASKFFIVLLESKKKYFCIGVEASVIFSINPSL